MQKSRLLFSTFLFFSTALILCGCEGTSRVIATYPAEESSSSAEKPSPNDEDDAVEDTSSIETLIPEMVNIDGLFWATTNLNKKVKGSRCYGNDTINCKKYGRLYTFAQAMGVSQEYDSAVLENITYPYQGVCPEGTYLPSHKQWNSLVNYLEKNPEYKKYFTNQVGGAFDYKGHYRSIGEETVFWSSTQYDDRDFADKYAWVWAFRNDQSRSIVSDNAHKITGGYVRCVKDAK